MGGLRDLDALLARLSPRLLDGEVVFVTVPGAAYGDHADWAPVAAVAEAEGLTLVVPRERAGGVGAEDDGAFRQVTLGVHSSLNAVGLTAAVAGRLAARGVSANVVAGRLPRPRVRAGWPGRRRARRPPLAAAAAGSPR